VVVAADAVVVVDMVAATVVAVATVTNSGFVPCSVGLCFHMPVFRMASLSEAI
jgi:hypothetical protein